MMALIFAMVPILFFLFSIFDVHSVFNESGNLTNSGRLPKHWVRTDSRLEKLEDKDGLNSLDFLADIPLDLDRLRDRAKYEYNYIKNA